MQFKDSREPIFEGFGDLMYQNLMTDMQNLREQLNDQRLDPSAIKRTMAEIKDELDGLEAMLVVSNRGWKALGSNDGERKYALDILKAKDEKYNRRLASLRSAEQEYAQITGRIEAAQKQLHAVGNAMRLHAAMVLAQSAVTVELPIAADFVSVSDDLDL